MKKILNLLLLIGSCLTFQQAVAAPSDCVQMAADGTAECIPARDNWTGIYGGNFPTYEELAVYSLTKGCNPTDGYVCREKDFVGMWDNRTCSAGSGTTCNVINGVYPNNKGGYLYYAYYPIANGTAYFTKGGTAIHQTICPKGYTKVYPNPDYEFALCKPPVAAKDLGCPEDNCKTTQAQGVISAADPINAGSGNKYEVETDYIFKSSYPLIFKRYFNNKAGGWSHSYNRKIGYSQTDLGEFISLLRPSGDSITFKNAGGGWQAASKNATFEIVHADNFKIEVKTESNEIETYTGLNPNSTLPNSNVFRLTSIKQGGGVFTISYNSNSVLSGVTDPFGRILTINSSSGISGCNGEVVPTSIIGPNGVSTIYEYNNGCQISKVIYPDNTFKEYVYSSGNLQSVKNELGNITQFNTYTTTGNRTGGYVATSNGLGPTGAVEKVIFAYPTTTTTKLTDARSNIVNISVKKDNNITKATGFDTLCTFCSGIQGSSITYNENGFVDTVVDFRGNSTKYNWDINRNLLLSSTEAYGTNIARTTTITWNSTWKLPSTITTPVSGGDKTTNVSYNNHAQPTSISIAAPAGNTTQTRVWEYVYDDIGQTIEIKNPLYASGINDKINMTYTDGLLSTITNGLQQTTLLSDYNVYGQPQTMTLPDSTIVSLTYDTRGRVLTSSRKNASNTKVYTTTYTYNAAGLITQLTFAAGNYQKVNYDTAHRIASIEEYDENNMYQGKMVFTLDNMSNITSTQVLDAAGAEIRVKTAQYDNKNMLYKDIGAINQTNTITYDANGNMEKVVDPNNKNVLFTYDALNRLSTQTSQDGGIIKITYNPDDTIANVQDPKNINTQYFYNGFGEVIKTISTDAGTSTLIRDVGGNVISATDAKNQTSNYTYDAGNRLVSIEYLNDSSKNLSLSYDCNTYATGKLCSIIDASGTTNYDYDDMGQLASKTHGSKTISYEYDNVGRLNKVIYPSGLQLTYGYANNHATTLQYSGSGISGTLISNAVYEPFSAIASSYTIGNVVYTRNFNKDGMISGIITNPVIYPINKTIGYDTRFNINALTDSNSSKSSTVGYDDVSRITSYNFGSNSFGYTYNTTGDRTSKTTNGAYSAYTYDANSHRLMSTPTSAFMYDNNGSVLTENNKVWNYDVTGRMSSYSDGIVSAIYQFNALGQRIYKNVNNQETHFVYDEGGNLIAEYIGQTLKIEYIYFNGVVVAINVPTNGVSTIYYVFNDHLGTPRAITDTSGNAQWIWENIEPFGNNAPVKVNTGFIDFNLRFPGQYYDAESGLNYNYHRDYNSSVGRYMQSDPIGLNGGINTYGYVGGNSLTGIDPLGLDATANVINNTININLSVELTGAALHNPAQSGGKRGDIAVIHVKNILNKYWKSGKWMYGRCNVNFIFDIAFNQKKTNTMKIIENDPDFRSFVKNDKIVGEKLYATTGALNLDIKKEFETPHEFAHLMSLRDKYTDTGGVYEGFKGNIMGEYHGIIEQKNINQIVENLLSKNQLGECGCIK